MANVHHPWVALLMLLPLAAFTQTALSIDMGSTLSTNGKSSWPSPSGEFAFGFIRLDEGSSSSSSNLFLLGIWFAQIPERTLVWSANRDAPVQEGSKVSLTNGELVLNDHQGREVWKADANGTVSSAEMLDNGNFVLMGSGSNYSWETFVRPTDTILPAQIIGLGGTLYSRESETNYSTGRFKLLLQIDGNLVLQEVALQSGSENAYGAYWKSGTAGNDSQLVFNRTGYIYLTLQNGNRSNITQGNTVPTRDFYHRATLDYDGVLRQYVFQKNRSGRWGESWTPVTGVPQDICMVDAVDVGGGVCGFNGYCKLDGSQPSCLCPTRYTYLDANKKNKGCREDFVPQSCGIGDSKEEPQFEMQEMPNTDWPLSDYEHYKSLNEDQCRAACLGDCRCAIAIFRDGNCWKKKLPLSNGRMNAKVGGKALIKVGTSNSTLPPVPPVLSGGKKDKGPLILIISVVLGSSVFLNFLLAAILVAIYYFSHHKKVLKLLPSNPNLIGINLRSFTYQELEEITNGFKDELGRGACGTVYKGIIASDSVTIVAVKKLDRVVKEAEKELKNEVSAIGRIHHKNLVQLLGYCHEGSNLLLVYEFMTNGSLANLLFGSPRPHWNQRTQIAFGIARGLMYLHEECGTQIIHCDIKPQNILLDDYFVAKISDFGLAKLLKTNQTRTTTDIRGTKGYVAPEWFKNNMAITAKVDVYSFGVMLLEIICCRKSFEQDLQDQADAVLIDWACDCYKEGAIEKLVADDEAALNDARRLERMVMVAIWCIQEDPSLRPSMKKVTQMLEGAVEVAVPPDPFSFISSLG